MTKRDDHSKTPGFDAAPNNPFGALEKLRGSLPANAPAAPAKPEPKGPARAVVRLERKGHGGKEVTVVSHLELKPKELDAWVSELKRALGCGGQVDGDLLVFQGDQRERVAPLLEKRGVRKVTVS
jgi:translation initiation factor 1